ncbi:hypothetical protein Moror_11770 [Moniliophthora roreri MCA 2997]|uniref:Uncharacterized protein n=1 Tax=Moniliophthora roreri (strain MCA 2997) TaxID=1381753 RepID=V2WN49_MONRO|nr:hypothetical protein Moror_11770 [Moniliophthora roreri MCA 2997]
MDSDGHNKVLPPGVMSHRGDKLICRRSLGYLLKDIHIYRLSTADELIHRAEIPRPLLRKTKMGLLFRNPYSYLLKANAATVVISLTILTLDTSDLDFSILVILYGYN